ncbi:hypothetical protein GWI33_022327 [Rhynchophorus ferrugineus]|uniref:NEDD4-binding protein 2-like 1 n=1 Tax=Rhynchophorus ferrugineus TaxID=354439 RepID=A0A834IQ51_RHYFE|nr:hypothetical protein GWI33_022327 [Rhynchophorus ferrugineus]
MSQMYNLTATRFAHSPEKKSKKRTEIDNVIQKINRGDKVLVLLRGLPGSGKSTLGHYILNNTIGDNEQTLRNHLLSTDDYFMKNGVYNYNSMLIGDAHGWNHQRAFSAMSKGYSPIIIDNTNVQMWEMKPYAMMATDFGYFLDILEPDTHWCFNEKELAKRNKHNVPKATIRNMIERYDKNVTPIKLLTAYDCKYKLQKPPQMRSYPPLTNRGGSQVNVNSVGAIKSKSMSEPINLMDFNEPAKNMSASKNKEDENKLFNSVDNLLMHQEDCIGNVLQPVLSKASKSTDLFENIKIWGIDEDALNSWDIVTPVKENHLDKMELLPVVTIDDDDIEMKDASTNTEDKYFTSLKRIRQNCSMDDLKVLVTCNRDINRNIASKQPGVRRKLMLDKSCMTEDFISDYQAQLEQLITVFPNIPLRSIEHWYNKCNRDIDWTIEFLLAEKGEALNVSIANEEDFRPTESIDQKMGSICIDSDSDSSNADRDSPRSTKNKRKYVNAESLELKKCIESKITIGDDHYSDKILKIKHFRFGENLDKSTDIKVNRSNETSPSTESPEQLDLSDEPFEFIEMDNHGSPSNSMDQLETVDLTLGFSNTSSSSYFVG